MPSSPFNVSALNMGYAQRWFIKGELDRVGLKFDSVGINYCYFKLFQMCVNTLGKSGLAAIAKEVSLLL